MTNAQLVETYESRLSKLSMSPRMSVSVEDMARLLKLARRTAVQRGAQRQEWKRDVR